jgi:hypothetical protein
MPKENAAPHADPEKSRGELNEGRPYPTEDVPTDGGEAARRRERMSEMEKADREMPRAFPDRDPAKKKTGEF